ncbi:MAG TPA: AlkA N-terminal domain-containing protein [Amycolatopsis sp.]|nr:AlkA N-terminal domain-containing protein [Amycolatopsis sp.]
MTAAATQAGHGLWRDNERCYRAVASRDARFDGQFIVAVKTTGIYCRPSCPALTPKAANVRFYPTSAAAQAGGFRACRRCLPDAVPGSPEWNLRADLAARAMRLISDGVVEREGVPGLARRLGYSERQLARVLTTELGAGPLALARAHRAHSARLLIELSELPLADVAFAAGFASVRQFNDTIREVFARTPSELRATATTARRRAEAKRRGKVSTGADLAGLAHADTHGPAAGTRLSLRLPYRLPFDAQGLFGFLAARVVPGVEWAAAETYGRTLRLPHGPATIALTPQDNHIRCDVRLADVRDLGSAVSRTRRLLDLDADPEAVTRVLSRDALLAPAVAATPGIRVPGAVDGPELLIRAMLGQHVSVAAARTAAGRLAAALGEPVSWAAAEGDTQRLFPTPQAVAERGHEVLRGPQRRIDAICGAARALAAAEVDLHVGRDADQLRAELVALPGVGPWTADYVLMRVLGAPDVLLADDLVVRKGAAALGIADLPACAQAWRPWRSYAGMYLWRSA